MNSKRTLSILSLTPWLEKLSGCSRHRTTTSWMESMYCVPIVSFYWIKKVVQQLAEGYETDVEDFSHELHQGKRILERKVKRGMEKPSSLPEFTRVFKPFKQVLNETFLAVQDYSYDTSKQCCLWAQLLDVEDCKYLFTFHYGRQQVRQSQHSKYLVWAFKVPRYWQICETLGASTWLQEFSWYNYIINLNNYALWCEALSPTEPSKLKCWTCHRWVRFRDIWWG